MAFTPEHRAHRIDFSDPDPASPTVHVQVHRTFTDEDPDRVKLGMSTSHEQIDLDVPRETYEQVQKLLTVDVKGTPTAVDKLPPEKVG